MIDDDDVAFAAIVGPDFVTGPVSCVFILVLLIALALIASDNKAKCETMHCAGGKPMLVKHECVCVGKPQPTAAGD